MSRFGRPSQKQNPTKYLTVDVRYRENCYERYEKPWSVPYYYKKHGCKLHAYVLMTNHVHLLITNHVHRLITPQEE